MPAPPDTGPMDTTDVPAEQAVEAFEGAKEENELSPMRRGQVIHLPDAGEVVMTGDLHDHRTNWRKLLAVADLRNHPERHLVLHELIHGDHFDERGAEDSWRMLYEACELKLDFPTQVHFLMANHDLAQIHGEGISKAGLDVCRAFNDGLRRDFGRGLGGTKDGGEATAVQVAVTEFLLSLPLAIRAPNGLWFSHSLPKQDEIDTFDYGVFDRDALAGEDFRRKTGAVYQLVWGRGVEPDGVDRFAERVGATMIVTGHQPQDAGFAVNGDKHLIVASDHAQGVFLPLDLSATYEMPDLVARLRKFVAVDA